MSIKGIDVSKYQKNIDWKKVKADGVEFAIIRAGYGKTNVDPYCKQNALGAIANGVKLGFYWFLYCKNEAEAIQNANKFHETIKEFKNHITMKVWCDYEYDSDSYSIKQGVVQTNASRTKIVNAFIGRMKELGYDCGIYANPDYFNNKFGDVSQYPMWLAYYHNSTGKFKPLIWQQSSKGSVDGIKGNVDMNVWYEERENATIKETVNNNPYPEPTRLLYKKVIMQRGDDVKWLQHELIKHNCLPAVNAKGKSNIDGILGNDTANAIGVFQKKAGITVDKKCGIVTREHLKL